MSVLRAYLHGTCGAGFEERWRRQLTWKSTYLTAGAGFHTAESEERSTMRTETSRRGGFTLVEIMIVVAIIGLLAAIAIPNFVKARSLSQQSACIENMRQIFGAKASWALETGKTPADTPTSADLFGETKWIRTEPQCPGGGTYDLKPVDTKPTCTLAGHSL
jgi:prepilin-type N-terminal cleavage/methylation domain-containing protein